MKQTAPETMTKATIKELQVINEAFIKLKASQEATTQCLLEILENLATKRIKENHSIPVTSDQFMENMVIIFYYCGHITCGKEQSTANL